MPRLWRALVDVAQVYRYQIDVVRHEAVEAVTLQRFQETHVYQRCSVKNTLIGLQQKKEIKYAHIFLTKSNNTATKCIHLYYTTKLTRHLQFCWKRNLYMDVHVDSVLVNRLTTHHKSITTAVCMRCTCSITNIVKSRFWYCRNGIKLFSKTLRCDERSRNGIKMATFDWLPQSHGLQLPPADIVLPWRCITSSALSNVMLTWNNLLSEKHRWSTSQWTWWDNYVTNFDNIFLEYMTVFFKGTSRSICGCKESYYSHTHTLYAHRCISDQKKQKVRDVYM